MTIDVFLTQLCEHCGVSADQIEVVVTEVDDRLEIQLNVPEEDSGRFIGYHGEAIQAMQRVLRLAFEQQHQGKKIILNVNDYRERRMAQLEEKVQNVAEQVLADGRPYTFNNFIPSHERYAIHTVLATVEGGDKLESYSEGEGMSRRLTIALRQDSGEDSSESNAAEVPETETVESEEAESKDVEVAEIETSDSDSDSSSDSE